VNARHAHLACFVLNIYSGDSVFPAASATTTPTKLNSTNT
jgi:hypothetical protein